MDKRISHDVPPWFLINGRLTEESFSLRPVCRRRRVESHALGCGRMTKLQMCAVESKTRGLDRAGTIKLIANDGMAALCKVNSDLMFSSGFETNFDKRCLRFSLQHSDVCDGKLADAMFRCGIDAIGSVFFQERADREFVRFDSTFDDGTIDATGGVILELTL